jgi:hypothetical protein
MALNGALRVYAFGVFEKKGAFFWSVRNDKKHSFTGHFWGHKTNRNSSSTNVAAGVPP